ncbi:MAG: TIGR04211 family SH3 domain-containing protein [Gammaproteobacteria bacterium]|nr:TIGR04211 family SH3 domain-containing protein [Gammaproteobacteria bacterium]
MLGALLVCPTAIAESLYVTDILRLGLHGSSDTSDAPFRILASGDELEILQRTTYYALVRTADGQEGWVKASYLTDDKPAQARLAELTLDRDSLATELALLRNRLAAHDNEMESVRSERESLKRNAATTTSELATLRADNEALSKKVATYKFSAPFRWLFAITTLTLVGGFIGGWWWTDARQRKRHGGFRI